MRKLYEPPFDPVIEEYKKHVDVSLLRESLKKTPEQRLLAIMSMAEVIGELRQAGGRSMARKRSVSSAPVKRTVGNARHMPDSQIDYSDIPASTDEELRGARRVGRPTTGHAKLLIAIRIHPRLLAKLDRVRVFRARRR